MSKNYDSKRIRGKLRVYKYLISNKSLKKFLPYSVALSKETLEQTTSRFRLLYVKPDLGTHGKGVIQLKKDTKTGKITARSTSSTKKFQTISKLYTYLKGVA